MKQLLQEKVVSLADYLETKREEDPRQYADRTNDNAESGDEAMENYEMIESEVLEGSAEEMLTEAQAALERIEQGTYGLDEETGEPIPFARLKLYPSARRTVRNEKNDENEQK